METPEKEGKPRPKTPLAPDRDPYLDISPTRKILIGIFILGFWIFFYWFRKP